MYLDKELEISERILDYLYKKKKEKEIQDSLIDFVYLKKYLKSYNTDMEKFTVHINFKYGFYDPLLNKYPYDTDNAIAFYTKVIRMFKLEKILE